MTSSPTATVSTSSPIAMTTPEASRPRRIGSCVTSVPHAPEYDFQSVGLTPAARTSSSTSPGPGSPGSTSTTSRTSGPPYAVATTACAIPRSCRQGRARSSAPLERRYPGAVTLRLFDTASRTMRELAPRPTYEPRATGHVIEMVELIQRLLEAGHAYVAGEGDVWFDVRSFADYGALTNQRLADLAPADDVVGAVGKRDPHDFALWKGAKAGEPESATWPTPFGRGRPGWHLECSAMARRYLGADFDIHGGGLDLRFPHHENERAQSRAAGDGFARLWLHAGLLNVNGAKMSKSLGNYVLVSDVLEETRPAVLRYALTAVQYRTTLEYGPETLTDAEATWNRIAGFAARAAERLTSPVTIDGVRSAPLPEAFTAALDDDLNVPAALAVVHEHIRAGNVALADGDPDEVRSPLVAVRGMLDVLGLDPQWWASATGDTREHGALDALVEAELAARQQARAAKDWAAADAVRDRLASAGIAVEDSPTGARWSLAEEN